MKYFNVPYIYNHSLVNSPMLIFPVFYRPLLLCVKCIDTVLLFSKCVILFLSDDYMCYSLSAYNTLSLFYFQKNFSHLQDPLKYEYTDYVGCSSSFSSYAQEYISYNMLYSGAVAFYLFVTLMSCKLLGAGNTV